MSPVNFDLFLLCVFSLRDQLGQLQSDLYTALSSIFYPDTIEEWLEVNVNPKVNKVTDIVSKAEEQLSHGARVKDYNKTNNMDQ